MQGEESGDFKHDENDTIVVVPLPPERRNRPPLQVVYSDEDVSNCICFDKICAS